MRHRVAKNTQANRRVDVARDFTPALQIGECVTISGLLFFLQSAAYISLTPCFSWVLQASHGVSTASAVYKWV